MKEYIKFLENKSTIDNLEKANRLIQKDWKKDNIPKYKLDMDLYMTSQKDKKYKLTETGTAMNRFYKDKAESNLNFMDDANIDTVALVEMQKASAGFAFMYKLSECGKNGRPLKKGGRELILTEYEMEERIRKGTLKTKK